MITISTILCPLDLSAESYEALRYAVTLAHTYRAKLLLLHCAGPKSDSSVESQHRTLTITQRFEDAVINHLGLTQLGDLQWEALAIENVYDVSEAIINQAANHHADLIIMHSRRRPKAAMILGSTAEKVCKESSCPVLVTHSGERQWVGYTTNEIDLRRVLVTYDFSDAADVALGYAASLAQEYQAELHLLHILPASNTGFELTWSDADKDNAYSSAVDKLAATIPDEVSLWCRCFQSVRCGSVYQEVLAYAREYEIDLICMGASKEGRLLNKLFGSNGDRIMRESPCPILVAHEHLIPKLFNNDLLEIPASIM